jgi:hypothetical protein
MIIRPVRVIKRRAYIRPFLFWVFFRIVKGVEIGETDKDLFSDLFNGKDMLKKYYTIS